MFRRITKMDEFIRSPKTISKAIFDISNDEQHGAQRVSQLGPTGHIKGDIVLDENLRIEGEVEGTITIRGKQLSIGKRARVKGEIRANTLEVRGTVEGDVHGDELVHVYSTAAITGSVFCQRIVVDDGARFNGLFRTTKDATKPSDSKETAKRSDANEAIRTSDNKPPLKSVGA